MEHAPLRPVPSRPAGPVDSEQAVRHVTSSLPGLDATAARALGLVALSGSSRPEAAAATGLEEDALGEALARARKALRRSMFPLPGSGWCERAERLVSDRLDGALEAPGPARLEVHLRNCPRCVEHERRLVQATDAMVAAFGPAPSAAPAAAPAPPLSVVKRSASSPLTVLPFGKPVRPAPARLPRPLAPPAPAPSLPEPAARPVPAPPARARPATSIAWTVLFILAAVLAVATVVIAVAGALGATL